MKTHRPNDDGDDTMNHHLLVAEFLTTPWALMPERLNAVAAVLARWSQDVPAGEDVLASIAADRNVREARRQATTAVSSGGIAVLPLVRRRHPARQHGRRCLGPGSVSTQQFASALRQALADDSVSQILIDIDSPGGSVYGVSELADEIVSARGQKPVVAIANSLAASCCLLDWLLGVGVLRHTMRRGRLDRRLAGALRLLAGVCHQGRQADADLGRQVQGRRQSVCAAR
jgi:hypothetical protein